MGLESYSAVKGTWLPFTDHPSVLHGPLGLMMPFNMVMLNSKNLTMKIRKKLQKNLKQLKKSLNPQKVKQLRNLGIGFGDVNATAENIPPGLVEPNSADIMVQASLNFCSKICRCCCCSCCIKMCPKTNNQCSIFLTQLCAALTICGCHGCFQCCQQTCCAESKAS